MELLRVSPYDIEAEISVSEAETEYTVTVQDLSDLSITTDTLTSSAASIVTVTLPSAYDGSYLITVDGEETEVSVVRPYVDANTKADTASEIAQYASHEEVARAIIDSVIPEGFYFQKRVIETTGTGADYIPLWINAKKVLKLYENNVLMYDSSDASSYTASYEITQDKTAIIQTWSEQINRAEGAPLILPAAQSDMLDLQFAYRGFAKTFDYRIIVESGYRNIPTDIVKAAELLIDDLACGKLDYYKRYVSDYSSEQFKIKFGGGVFEGTGNILVDKILSKYAKSIRMLGVL